MLLSAVSVLVVAQSSSEIPEGLMNNPVHEFPIQRKGGCVVRGKLTAVKPEYFHKREK